MEVMRFGMFGISGGFASLPTGNWSYVITQIPLPAPLLLLVTALAGLFGVSRLQRKAVAA